MIVAMNSPSCSDDHSETTTTTASTMSNGDNKHEKHMLQAKLSSLESKIMTVISENTRLRSDMKRQSTTAAKTIADLTERLDKLEKAKESSSTDPVLEARLGSLERIVIKGEAPRTCRASHGLHSSLPDLSSSTRIAGASTRTRSRSRTRAMSNRVANAKAVSDALLQDESNNEDNDTEDVSMSFGTNFIEDSSKEQEGDKGDKGFPILSSPMRSPKKLNAFLSSTEEQETNKDAKDNRSVASKSVASRRREARKTDATASSSPVKKLTPIVLSPVRPQKQVLTGDEARRFGTPPPMSPPSSSSVKTKVTALPDGKLRELCRPFTPLKLARAQARDEALAKHQAHGGGGMYPSFCMSVQSLTEDNDDLYMFRKCVYVPESLRQAVMEYYYRLDGSDGWGANMCRHKIWPTIDSDITNFVPPD